ncbi:hypothetical protein LCGC14_1541440 [marine sediment metagenome]|uniref:Uncharacterized protein n=1 Tax=marine sediment metagenome TaxID=412755 RepID=A0A0F9L8Z9_9ZZZZ
MKLAFISNLSFLELCSLGDIEMCLAPLVWEGGGPGAGYGRYYKQAAAAGRFVILDNGAAEGALMSPSDLLDLVDEMRPAEVVAPDIIYDGPATITAVLEFLQVMGVRRQGKRSQAGVMAVPQGSTRQEYMHCAAALETFPKVTTLGLSKRSTARCFGNDDTPLVIARTRAVDALSRLTAKPLHLLGGDWSLPWEVARYASASPYASAPAVRSNDSSFVYWYSREGVSLTSETRYLPAGALHNAPPVDLFAPVSPEARARALRNGEVMIQLARGEVFP